MNEWYKDVYFYRKKGPAWEKDIYGQEINGKGDLIFNTCAKIIDDEDKGEWAVLAIENCYGLLERRERWPDRMIQPNDADNWFQWKLSQLKFWLGIKTKWYVWDHDNGSMDFEPKMLKTVMYRPQNNMTRDPFIAFFTAVTLSKNVNSTLTIPWYLFRPSIWIWRRYLIIGRGLWLYYFLTLNYPKRDYVRRLRGYMDKAVELKNSQIIEERLQKRERFINLQK